MILLLDAGNTRLKWGAHANGRLLPGAWVAYDGAGLEANLENTLGAIEPPARVLLCSVAEPATNRRLVRWLRNRWPVPLAQVVPGRRGCGVRNAYAEPERLGADRWAALVGARARYAGRSLCVVDAGTAVTIDGLDASGVHAGGVIVPGLALARGSLAERTGRIGSAEGGDEAGGLALGASTRDAVRHGARYQLVALLDRVVEELRAQWGDDVQGILTGGDAPVLMPLLRAPFVHHPTLVLDGLVALARRGCNQQPVAG